MPVKSLGRLYSIPLTDRHRGTEVQKVALKGLKSIDKTCLPGKMKAWCYQHGLLPRLLWPLEIYEIAISRVERIQQYSNKYLRKWLGAPPCFSKVGLYFNSGTLQLPISSLVEEFKIGKVRLHMMMKDSADEIIQKAYPEIKLGTKRNAAYESKTSLASLKPIELGWVARAKRYSSKWTQKEKETWWAKKSGCLRKSKDIEKDIDTRLTKAWTAIEGLSIIWKSDLTDEMKRSFFQTAVVSILLYGCTTWTLAKRLKKKLDGNYTRMLRAILNKSWRQHPTRHQL